jgi:hypothetical protein
MQGESSGEVRRVKMLNPNPATLNKTGLLTLTKEHFPMG